MIGTFRKHSTWLWAIIIAAMSVSLVVWMMPSGRQSQFSDSSGNFGSILGRTISRDQFREAMNDVRLQYFFSNGAWPDEQAKRKGFDVDRETYYHLLLNREMQDLNIHVSGESVGSAATAHIAQLTQGQAMPLDDFVKAVLAPQGLGKADLASYLAHEIGIQQLIALFGAGGRMATPAEIRSLYQREHENVAVEAAFFQATNFLPRVSVTTPALMQFYTNRMPDYKLPERVQVSYVSFPSSNYLAEAKKDVTGLTNLDEVLEANLDRMGTNFDAEAKTPAEKKTKIQQMMVDEKALQAAAKKANELTARLGDIEAKPGNLASVAQTEGIKAGLSEPFDNQTPPKDLNVGMDFVQRAFELSPDNLYFGPIRGKDGVYVIELAKRLPDENPPYDAVKDRVLADYKFNQAVMLARLAGGQCIAALTNSANRGRTFSAVCQESGVRPENVPPFSISTKSVPEVESRVQLNRFKEAVFGTAVGQVSPFMPSADGGYVVYVQSKLRIPDSQYETDLPKFAAMVQQSRAYEAFNQWFSAEAQKGLRETPLAHPQQAGGGTAPAAQN